MQTYQHIDDVSETHNTLQPYEIMNEACREIQNGMNIIVPKLL